MFAIEPEDEDQIEEEQRDTIPGVYLGDFKSDSLRLVPVAALTELDAAEIINDDEYLSEDILCSVELPTEREEPTNPRFYISGVSGVVSIPPTDRAIERPSFPANELYRRVWCCADEE